MNFFVSVVILDSPQIASDQAAPAGARAGSSIQFAAFLPSSS